jgi:hypothetical protein
MNLPLRGISINLIPKGSVSGSIRVNREFDSNEINESELQPEKHDIPRI